MKTLYEVIDRLGNVKATFVFREDAEDFVRQNNSSYHIRELRYDETGRRVKEKKDKNNE